MTISTGYVDKKVLVVEDEQKIVRLLKANLESVGFQVIAAANAKTATAMLALTAPDIVILDIMLPDENGYELCRKIRETCDVPIIMLTAKVREADKLMGFAVGADDYVTKPFSSAELIARVKALLKRTGREEQTAEPDLVIGNLRICFTQRKVYKHAVELRLTATEYALLYHLAKNCGCVMLHEDLLRLVWGPEYRTEVEYLRAYIWRLRRKIEDDPAHPQLIVSNLGIGYSCNLP